MADISLVGRQRGGFPGTLTDQDIPFALTGGSDSAPVAGDIVFVSYAVGMGALSVQTISIKDLDGTDYEFPLPSTRLIADGVLDSQLIGGYKIMGGTPDTGVRFTSSAGGTGRTSDAGGYDIIVLREVDPAAPMDVPVTEATGVGTRIPDPPSITPATVGAWTHHIGAAVGATGGTFTSGDLSDFLAGFEADTNDVLMGAGILAKPWSSGAQNPAPFGGGGVDTANDAWTAFSVAFKPAAGDAGEAPVPGNAPSYVRHRTRML